MQPVTIKYLPIFNDNPDNPARCEVATGVIEINKFIWQFLTPEQREFVLAHEKGHYERQTFDEVQADQYALEKLKLRKKNSLWNYVKSVRAISHDDPLRCRNAERNALQVAADNGSKEAKQLLQSERYRQFANADGNATAGNLPIDINIPFGYAMIVILLVVVVCIIIGIKL